MSASSHKNTYLRHLQTLVAKWENLLDEDSILNTSYYALYERSKSLIDRLCPDSQDFFGSLDKDPSKPNIERLIGKLRATHHDLNKGLLYIERQIQEATSVDLMQQAEQLLGEDDNVGPYEHVPAAVLAGAVLEHFLRTLCKRQTPPIPIHLDNGNYKTLAYLVNDLEKVGLYNGVQKKQLKVWVGLRNNAAHGQFDQFNRQQVEKIVVLQDLAW